MSKFALPPSDPIAMRIRAAAERGVLSHALLFTGPGDRSAAAQYAAAAFQCQSQNQTARPCGSCPACRKVLSGIHPDVITVEDPEHKYIAIDIVRRMRADAYVRPNEGERKVYLFPDCALLTPADQNVLLKLVEEGPPYAAFLFCAENGAVVLQTLRSRCVEWKTRPSAPAAEHLELAETLCRRIASKERGALAELAVELERKKLPREKLSALLEREQALFSSALLLRYGRAPAAPEQKPAELLAKSLTNQQLMHTIELLQKYRKACVYNVGTGHILGALAVELEENL